MIVESAELDARGRLSMMNVAVFSVGGDSSKVTRTPCGSFAARSRAFTARSVAKGHSSAFPGGR
jgi:hypothetical protein